MAGREKGGTGGVCGVSVPDPDTHHVYPVADLIEHAVDGGECVCGPEVEAVQRDDGSMGWLITHHSLDGRERFELAACDHKWGEWEPDVYGVMRTCERCFENDIRPEG